MNDDDITNYQIQQILSDPEYHRHYLNYFRVIYGLSLCIGPGIIILGSFLLHYNCSYKYIIFIIMGSFVLLTDLVMFAMNFFKLRVYKTIYLILGITMIIITFPTASLIKTISNQTLCNWQWCHKQVLTDSYMKHINEEDSLSSVCNSNLSDE